MERFARAGQEGQDDLRLLCRAALGIGNGELEVCCDMVFWLDDMILPWDFVQQSFMELVPAVANVLLPEVVSAVVGKVTLPPPVVEIHLATHRPGEQDQAIENVVDVTTLGAREAPRPFYSTGEVLDETLTNGHDRAPAILDAFTVMAMDWGHPSPVFLDQNHDVAVPTTRQPRATSGRARDRQRRNRRCAPLGDLVASIGAPMRPGGGPNVRAGFQRARHD
ncbi:hypothetical protein [Streptomyces violascens]|uniref:Uncharacterized protein n=1 Tax=Streptomyces violascens TaxID=67381 RepID=A0ABQ3QS58_9ACTN|nr:hypothetical protein [Streptomyces violascens]GGU51489.1 hypothetical protein GCM10010289_84830 [Streptomyces violascens]GHI40094.1 hypothetical protein Sviol_45020 [Streptomyces violascens]